MWGDILVYRDRLLLSVFPLKLRNSLAKILETACVTSVGRAVDEIILAKAVAHGLTSIRIAQYLTIALYTHRIILRRTDAVWV